MNQLRQNLLFLLFVLVTGSVAGQTQTGDLSIDTFETMITYGPNDAQTKPDTLFVDVSWDGEEPVLTELEIGTDLEEGEYQKKLVEDIIMVEPGEDRHIYRDLELRDDETSVAAIKIQEEGLEERNKENNNKTLDFNFYIDEEESFNFIARPENVEEGETVQFNFSKDSEPMDRLGSLKVEYDGDIIRDRKYWLEPKEIIIPDPENSEERGPSWYKGPGNYTITASNSLTKEKQTLIVEPPNSGFKEKLNSVLLSIKSLS